MRRRNSLFIAAVAFAVALAGGFLYGVSKRRSPQATPYARDPIRLNVDAHEEATIIGNSLPGSWRPFSPDSPWNTPIPADAETHEDSDAILFTMAGERKNLKLINTYLCPIWVVNSGNMPKHHVRSDRIFDRWDQDGDGWSDVPIPATPSMWAEPTEDGQISIVDPFIHKLWDMSSFRWQEGPEGTHPVCTSFDVWDLQGSGVADPRPGTRWLRRGGRGSGFPGIAGIVRPEEIERGEIRHALCFSFNKNRKYADKAHIFLPPACRSDGRHIGSQYPVMGMRFQLDPSLTDEDFDRWGLNRDGKVLARALQQYGMFLGLTGGPMKLEVQLLAPGRLPNRREWDRRFPGFYKQATRIPTGALRIVDTGEPVIRSYAAYP